jgi:pimeloyl-ACP methyl ester carboxylesterase
MNCSGIGLICVIFSIALAQVGCAPQPVNPSLPVSIDMATRDLKRMTDDPKPLDRPLVIITGFMDPGIAAVSLESRFRCISGDCRIVAISLFECGSFESCRRKVMRTVDGAFPCADQMQTTDVDVVGYSMGGLVARLAANPPQGVARRLRIKRLFTISTPNQGAIRARELPLLHPLQADMRPGSALITRLNATPTPYTVYSYIHFGDKVIGETNAVIPGGELWWVSTPALDNPHLGAPGDPRIIDDISRRLRGEMPVATTPPTPLPDALQNPR